MTRMGRALISAGRSTNHFIQSAPSFHRLAARLLSRTQLNREVLTARVLHGAGHGAAVSYQSADKRDDSRAV